MDNEFDFSAVMSSKVRQKDDCGLILLEDMHEHWNINRSLHRSICISSVVYIGAAVVFSNQIPAGTTLNLPPSMVITLPFRYAPARLAKYNVVPAISCSVPVLCCGTFSLVSNFSPRAAFSIPSSGLWFSAAPNDASMPAVSSLGKTPGAMALQRILYGASIVENDLVILAAPAFEEVYAHPETTSLIYDAIDAVMSI